MKKEILYYLGRQVGYIIEECGIYISYRTKEHIFHIFGDGFGISEKLFDYLGRKNVKTIVINFEGKVGFWADLDTFLVYAEDYVDKGDNQYILPRKYWKDNFDRFSSEVQATL